jgi:NADH-quinone oxidoreductase subunit L
LSDVFDGKLVDGAVDGVARLFRGAGTGLRRVQTGFVRQYALGVVVGVVGLLLYALARSGVG